MATVQVKSEVNIEMTQLLDGVAQLDATDLEHLLSEVSILLARKRAPSLPSREAKLLRKINQGLSIDVQQRYDSLSSKLQSGTITPEEHQAFLVLIEQSELADAERLESLMELAQLRGISLDELINQLGIKPPPIHA